VETEFSEVRFHGDKERAKKVYEGFEPLRAQDIAETIWFVASRPPHVNINDMLVMPTAQANTSHLLRE
jgi:NADP-dependent 3-hydroxy acid dehydrogenase YdfG